MLPEATLPGGARTSRLGFGCSALLGGRTRREARRLLDAAFDSGIRHFDVARVYGTGDAEAVLGEFAAGRRERLTIASKFGIDPAGGGGGAGARLGKGAVRALTRRSRRALAFARRHGGRTVRRGAFEPEKARMSLAVSLAALRTDRLDAYLLHDCGAADWGQPALQEELAGLVAEGVVGTYGPATAPAAVEAIVAAAAPAPAIVQLGVDLSADRDWPQRSPIAVTHGVYRGHLARLRERLAEPATAAAWSADLDLDLGDGNVLGDLMLAAALQRNPGGIVLVSAGSPERIQRNAACAAQQVPFAPEQLEAFLALVRSALAAERAGAAAG